MAAKLVCKFTTNDPEGSKLSITVNNVDEEITDSAVKTAMTSLLNSGALILKDAYEPQALYSAVLITTEETPITISD